jgi:pimeloyl-ACP methyl ester carboxylesterase
MTVEAPTRKMPAVSGVEHRYVDVGDARIHVAEAGSGPPVVLLHGFPEHWLEWRDIMPALAAEYHVIAPDLRGFGWSDAPARGYGRRAYLDDLVRLLDALELERVAIVSHDVGALIGFALSIEHPQRVRRHVAIAVPPPFLRPSWQLVPMMRHLWFQVVLATPGVGARFMGRGEQRLPRYLLRSFSAEPDGWEPDIVESYLAQFREPARAKAASAVYRRLILPEFLRILTGRYRHERLHPPTLLAIGGSDQVLPPPFVRHMLHDSNKYANRIGVRFIRNAGHYVPEDQPDALVTRLLDYLQPRLGEPTGSLPVSDAHRSDAVTDA